MLLNLTDEQLTLVQLMAAALKQQAITWANVDPDLCPHMVSLDLNSLTDGSHKNIGCDFITLRSHSGWNC